MLESRVERALVREVKRRDGVCLKLVMLGRRGFPDRTCLFPGGRVLFVETKAPGRVLGPLQRLVTRRLRGLGFDVEKLDHPDQVGPALQRFFARRR